MARRVLDRVTDRQCLDPPRDRKVRLPVSYEEWLRLSPAESRITE